MALERLRVEIELLRRGMRRWLEQLVLAAGGLDSAAGQVEVARLPLDADEPPAGSVGGNARRPAAHERVQNDVAGLREQAQQVRHQAARLLGRVLVGRPAMA